VQLLQVGAQGVDIPFWEDNTGVTDHVGDFAGIAADDGHGAGHGLDEHAAELFFPGGRCAAGDRQHVELAVEGGHLRARNSPHELHPIGHAEFTGQTQQRSFLTSAACQLQLPVAL